MRTLNSIVRYSRFYFSLVIIAGCLLITACDDSSSGGELGSLPNVTFTATPLSSNPNKIVVQSTTEDAFMFQWDFGNGKMSKNKADTVTYINKGDYTISLTAYNQGGSSTVSQQVNIASDYEGQNILEDDGALTADNWTYLNIPGGGKLNVEYTDNMAIFTDAPYSYGAIFQSVQVQTGQKYLLTTHISGNGMGNESWFELYLGTSEPQQGSDYMDNKFVSLNTYVPCGNTPFDGDLVNLSCSGVDTGGIITFDTSGTAYLVIKAGSNNGTLGDGGVKLESVSLMPIE